MIERKQISDILCKLPPIQTEVGDYNYVSAIDEIHRLCSPKAPEGWEFSYDGDEKFCLINDKIFERTIAPEFWSGPDAGNIKITRKQLTIMGAKFLKKLPPQEIIHEGHTYILKSLLNRQ